MYLTVTQMLEEILVRGHPSEKQRVSSPARALTFIEEKGPVKSGTFSQSVKGFYGRGFLRRAAKEKVFVLCSSQIFQDGLENRMNHVY